MNDPEVIRLLNLVQLLGLVDAGPDDIDSDCDGNVFICDGLNRRVYKMLSDGESVESFDISHSVSPGSSLSLLSFCVSGDSGFSVADSNMEIVAQFDDRGLYTGEFFVHGLIGICSGQENSVYTLVDEEGIEMVNRYDDFGFPMDTLPAPAHHRGQIGSDLASITAGEAGDIFISYGMPPYRIWRVKSDGSEIDAWGREFDHPEDAILISDIAFDHDAGVLWALLACKNFGRQVLDAWTANGEYVGSIEIPHSRNLYGALCIPSPNQLCLLDTAAGDLLWLRHDLG